MFGYVIRRLLQAIPVLILITAIVFAVVYLIPGDPAAVVLGRAATPENLVAMRHQMGLDRPLPVRYGIWLSRMIQGDLGNSILSKQPVIAVAIAVPAGMLAALKRNTWVDLVCTTWAFLGVSIPSFWLAIVLVYIFGVRLGWVPLEGYISPGQDFVASLKTMILPAFTLGIFISGPLMRYLRSSMLQTLSSDFVLVARAKGLSERRVVAGHVMRNSLIPFVTALGIYMTYLIGGAVIVENVFALPGMGDLVVSAIGNRDYPLIQGVVLVVALVIVLINICVDILYSALDPRIRVGGGSR
jgi:peptide/nickel transport system permease protein